MSHRAAIKVSDGDGVSSEVRGLFQAHVIPGRTHVLASIEFMLAYFFKARRRESQHLLTLDLLLRAHQISSGSLRIVSLLISLKLTG